MSIKQTINTPIQTDPNKRPSVVNEANDGIKAVPVELVTKAADDSTFTQVSQDNPIPVTGNLQLTGSIAEYMWLHSDAEPVPTETRAIGVKIESDHSMTTLYWNGTSWNEVV